jgi:symplekin
MAATPVADQLRQLGDARALVLGDPVYWPQVLHGILPIVSGPIVELRRWGADFLAETFSTPVVDINEKQSLAVTCLDTMVRLMDEKEAGILKSVVQCSASVYPLVFRYMYVLLPLLLWFFEVQVSLPLPIHSIHLFYYQSSPLLPQIKERL